MSPDNAQIGNDAQTGTHGVDTKSWCDLEGRNGRFFRTFWAESLFKSLFLAPIFLAKTESYCWDGWVVKILLFVYFLYQFSKIMRLRNMSVHVFIIWISTIQDQRYENDVNCEVSKLFFSVIILKNCYLTMFSLNGQKSVQHSSFWWEIEEF